MSDQPYTKTELMICVAARLFHDGTTAFIGTGIPSWNRRAATQIINSVLV